ncbi:MAG: hypothetical protein H7A25_12355 [Leptospiraceae bacterium]|nr:hypothetical protein [Leptospiraceae bacterium]MCP5500692.1 hypothetical protein [Leptospiraceae bacterium]
MKRLLEECKLWLESNSYDFSQNPEMVLKMAIEEFYKFFYDINKPEIEKELLQLILKDEEYYKTLKERK